jgi:hypothetical protein
MLSAPILIASSASATTNPPWEPDTLNAVGNLTFYNQDGTAITGGSNLSHLFDYAEGTTADANSGVKSTVYFANPTPGADPSGWTSGGGSVPHTTPNTTAPAPLNAATNPVGTVGPTGANLSTFMTGVDTNTQAGYANVYQVRMSTTGGDGGSNSTAQFWESDILVDPSSGTWVEEYPVQGSAAVDTHTALAATPMTSSTQGASVTLTATITADDSTNPGGSVEFDQDGQALGTGTVSGSTASLVTSALLPSSPSGTSLTAAFTPSNTSSYSPSASSALAYTVNPVAKKPTISGAHQVGAAEKCTEGTLDFGVTASYAWLVGGKKAGSGASFTVPASDYRKSLSCSVTVHDGSGPASAAQTSKAVTVSLGKALRATKKPKLSGAAKVGKTEKVTRGTWSPGATSYTYQWYLGGKKIAHATKSSYKLVKRDEKKSVTCRVTAKRTGYASGTAASNAVKVKK